MKRRTVFGTLSAAVLSLPALSLQAGRAAARDLTRRNLIVLGKLSLLQDLAISGGVSSGDHVQLPQGRFQVTARPRQPANGATVIDLAGGKLQAVLSAGECIADVSALLADTRPQDWFDAGGILRTRAEGFIYEVTPAGAAGVHLTTAGGVGLRPTGRDQFTPEAFGARGDGRTNDTDAWNRLLAAAAGASRDGPVHVRARGAYLLDQLAPLSQYGGPDVLPVENSVSLDFRGACFRHSGTGSGLFDLEGHNRDRGRIALRGGVFEGRGAAASGFALRLRDLRGALIQPEAVIGFEHGVLAQIWRSWSENVTYGGDEALEGRGCRHVLTFQGRREAWAHQIALQGGPVLDAAGYRGVLDSDPAGSESGGYYFNAPAGAVRVHAGGGWEDWLRISDVDTSVSGRSFARTRVTNVLIAHAADVGADGQILNIDGASLYDSFVGYLRGNTPNGGGSLIYVDDPFLLHSVIENVGVEMANDPARPESFAVRTGPKYAGVIRAPLLRNVHWTGGHARPADPAAGLPIGGEQPGPLDLKAGETRILVPAGLMHAGTTLRITLRDGAARLLSQALIARRTAAATSEIADAMGVTHFLAPAPRDADRFVAPRSGIVVGFAAPSDGGSTDRPDLRCVIARRTPGGTYAVQAVLDRGGLTGAPMASGNAVSAREFAAGDMLHLEAAGGASPADRPFPQVELRLDGPVRWRETPSGDIGVSAPFDRTDVRVFVEVLKG